MDPSRALLAGSAWRRPTLGHIGPESNVLAVADDGAGSDRDPGCHADDCPITC
jgi:hypothetical protein